ncbi:T9SS type A sorting domain-containing protein [Flavobacterium sp. CBA20B-1]|uniref:T9SS type A sorting domain-containing protein n=1 Tax=unclassified Flavobacterium TaxID=196869 RepID=UPI0022258FF3|nr:MULTISPECIES: T9SS type A sorting domain-containing protein [unclassified Flavobacterium]WCM41005.1 T9SS type A sorting domain-containing protein [Flavobacterium sp. CBA20B-1]
MKKILLIITTLLGVHNLTAQVLYTENFNNYALGELSADPTGVTPGKGGWYVIKNKTPYTFPVEITPEPGRGNVLAIGSNTNNVSGNGNGALLTQKNINTLWDNRTVGNNILKLEYDIYLIGTNQYRIETAVGFNKVSNGNILNVFMNNHSSGVPSAVQSFLWSTYYDPASTPIYKQIFLGTNNTHLYNNFPYNTWLTVELFVDYEYEAGNVIGGKIYVYIPALNILKGASFTHNENIDSFFISGFGSGNLTVTVKYDNIKLTALNTLPSYLGVENFLAENFNLYPNPANSVVNITNTENMQIQQITVYDVAGKQLSTQTYTNETEIQLNVEHLASGTYMLHLQTNQGTAVKKLVKK